ncbi:TPA: hypothetical protein ACGOZ0_000254 [Streptococcus suis]
MKLITDVLQNIVTPLKKQLRLFRNRKELKRVKKRFFKNNSLQDGVTERYVKSFYRSLGNFIGGNKLLQSDSGREIKRFLLDRIESDFVYYSENYIRIFLKKKYDEISLFLDDEGDSWNNCYVSSILNKDTSTINSSREMLTFFRELNGLPRNTTFTLEKYFQYEMNFLEVCNEYEEKRTSNPHNIYNNNKFNAEKKKYEDGKRKLIQEFSDAIKSKRYFIFIDDFSGSGATIKNFFKIMEEYFDNDIKIIIICIHMMEKGEKKLNAYFDSSKYKNKVTIYTDDSRINSRKKFFTNKKDPLKKKIREFEEQNFHQQFALGFEATEALVATYDNCPNNTFSSFWFSENPEWTPLFYRPRKRSQALNSIVGDKSIFVSNVKYALKTRGVGRGDIKLIIILLAVKSGRETTTNRIEIDLKDNFFYNDDDIQECLSNQYITIKFFDNSRSTYILTPKGKNKLKEYKLSSSNFEKLVSSYEKSSNDKIGIEDDYKPKLLKNKSAE